MIDYLILISAAIGIELISQINQDISRSRRLTTVRILVSISMGILFFIVGKFEGYSQAMYVGLTSWGSVAGTNEIINNRKNREYPSESGIYHLGSKEGYKNGIEDGLRLADELSKKKSEKQTSAK